MKDFMNHRERSSIFSTSTGSDIRYLLLLILQTCVLSGTVVYACTVDLNPSLLQHFSSTSLLSLFSASFLLYILLKWIVYSFIGRTFFDNSKTSLWMESYSTLLYYLGFTLFPLALFIIYFNLSIPVSIAIGVILVIFIKILMFYKWIKLFCNNLYGGLTIIVYFCALEIVPYFILYQGMTQLIDYLIIKI